MHIVRYCNKILYDEAVVTLSWNYIISEELPRCILYINASSS